jgi:hypothetical protein
MLKRPTSVTVIAWILIVMSSFTLIALTMTPDNSQLIPPPTPLEYALICAQPLATLIAGIAMLSGRNWARLLYVIPNSIGVVLLILRFPGQAGLIPGSVIFAVITIFLFLPKANEYFAPKKAANDVQGV